MAKFYLRQLDLADKEERKWRERSKKIVKRYRDEDGDQESRFNILWSNTQTQLPALFSSRPKPDVRRRWKQANPVGREIATAVERALEYSMDNYNFERFGEKLVLDFLLPGRMVARVRYHPFTEEREEEILLGPEDPLPEEDDLNTVEEQDDGSFIHRRKFEVLIHEEVRAYHVPWDKYRQSPADCWDDVWWVAYGDNFLTKEEIVEQFGEEHEDVPLTFSDSEGGESPDDAEIKRAQVWEVWDKEARKVVAVVKGYDEFLMEEDDPLKLKGFFPQPEPALMIETSDSLIPIPEYTMYQAQALELNDISERIASLTKSMKAVGFYPGDDAKKMNELMASQETMLVPVENWAAYAEKGGLKGMIDWLPIKEIADVWQRLVIQRENLTAQIFELIGISDIQRGMSDPRETRGAQELKANFGSRRLQPKQQRVQRFFRDILRIKAELIAENFDPTTLSLMTGTEVTPEMRSIMRSDALRSFTIDVETDSTVLPDEQQEKQGVAEFLNAMSNFLSQAAPIIQAQPASVQPLGKMLLWMSRKFKIARDVEQEIEDFIQAFQQMPDARNTEAEAKAKAEQQELAQKLQLMAQEKAKKLEIDEMEAQREQDRKDREFQREQARKDAEARAKIARENAQLAADMRRAGLEERQIAGKIAEIEAKARIAKEGKDDKVVPINRDIRLVRDENGMPLRAEVTTDGETQTIDIVGENA